MLSEAEGFTPLPGEQRLYTSPPRTALSLQTLNKFPGKQPYTISSSGGCIHLTSRRVRLHYTYNKGRCHGLTVE